MIVDVFTIIKIDDITYKSTILYELKVKRQSKAWYITHVKS